MSFFGVLLGYSPDLADLLGREQGGAYYYLESLERVVQVFDNDFDTMVTPVAYDMRLAFTTSADFSLAQLYGVPGDRAGEPAYEVEVATAFLSNRRGAVVARLDRLAAGVLDHVGTVSLSYTPEPALGWSAPENPGEEQPEEQIEEIRAPTEPSAEGTFYLGPGVRKSVALVNMGQQMAAACESYHAGDRAQARAMLAELASYLATEAEALADPALAAEIDLIDRLIANMQ
jgi:Ca-activated chloride channel family protein